MASSNLKQTIQKIVYGAILIIALWWGIDYIFNYTIDRADLVEYTATLSCEPEFDSSGKGNKVMRLRFIEEGSKYLTSGIGYNALDKEGVKEDLSTGSIVTVLIAKETGLNEYLDGFANVRDIYGLSANGVEYLTLEAFNDARKSNRLFFPILWLVFFGIYLYSFWIKERLDKGNTTEKTDN